MGLGGISVWQLLIVLAIVVLLFGTSRLRTLGGDLGSAIRGFRHSLRDTESGDDNVQGELSEKSPIDEAAVLREKQTT